MESSRISSQGAKSITADQLAVGEEGRVLRLSSSVSSLRLLGMGIVPGSTMQVVRRRSLKGTLYLRVNKLNLALRQSEAQLIHVSV